MLREFIAAHRDEIIGRCRMKVAMRSGPSATQPELEHVPLVLTHLVDALRLDLPASPEESDHAPPPA